MLGLNASQVGRAEIRDEAFAVVEDADAADAFLAHQRERFDGGCRGRYDDEMSVRFGGSADEAESPEVHLRQSSEMVRARGEVSHGVAHAHHAGDLARGVEDGDAVDGAVGATPVEETLSEGLPEGVGADVGPVHELRVVAQDGDEALARDATLDAVHDFHPTEHVSMGIAGGVRDAVLLRELLHEATKRVADIEKAEERGGLHPRVVRVEALVVDVVGVQRVGLDDDRRAQDAMPRELLERVRHGAVVVERDDTLRFVAGTPHETGSARSRARRASVLGGRQILERAQDRLERRGEHAAHGGGRVGGHGRGRHGRARRRLWLEVREKRCRCCRAAENRKSDATFVAVPRDVNIDARGDTSEGIPSSPCPRDGPLSEGRFLPDVAHGPASIRPRPVSRPTVCPRHGELSRGARR